jgi:ferric-dicitrate binding protein FerR (iron transport regulator)
MRTDEELDQQLKDLPAAPPPPAALRASVLALTAEAPVIPLRRSTWRQRAPLLAAAAAAVLVLAVAPRALPGPTAAPTDAHAQVQLDDEDEQFIASLDEEPEDEEGLYELATVAEEGT